MSKRVYDGFLKVDLIESEVKGKVVSRERLVMRDSVAGVLRNEEGLYCFVKQYRPVVKETLYEIPAGICDKEGLSYEEILIEEIEEECEISRENISSIKYLIDYYMAIGFSDSKLYIYEVELENVSSESKEVNDVDVESIEWLSLEEIDCYIKEGKIKDNKTILIYYYLLNKEKTN